MCLAQNHEEWTRSHGKICIVYLSNNNCSKNYLQKSFYGNDPFLSHLPHTSCTNWTSPISIYFLFLKHVYKAVLTYVCLRYLPEYILHQYILIKCSKDISSVILLNFRWLLCALIHGYKMLLHQFSMMYKHMLHINDRSSCVFSFQCMNLSQWRALIFVSLHYLFSITSFLN